MERDRSGGSGGDQLCASQQTREEYAMDEGVLPETELAVKNQEVPKDDSFPVEDRRCRIVFW